MKSTRSASRYAKALLELAIEQNKLDVVAADLKHLSESASDSRDFSLFLASPVIKADKKMLVFREIFGQFDALTQQFIDLIIKNGREILLLEIAASYQLQMKAHLGIVPVTLTAAAPMDEAGKKQVMEKVAAYIGDKKIELEERIDASLIGGFVVNFGDTQIDASVANQLKTLKQQLTK